MNLKNAVALITGGSVGIGHSIAQTLAASGARVAITGRNKARLVEAAEAIGAFPIQAYFRSQLDGRIGKCSFNFVEADSDTNHFRLHNRGYFSMCRMV